MYSNASEVIREALRFLDLHEDRIYEMKMAKLRGQIQVGIDQIERGECTRVNSEEELEAYFNEIMEVQEE